MLRICLGFAFLFAFAFANPGTNNQYEYVDYDQNGGQNNGGAGAQPMNSGSAMAPGGAYQVGIRRNDTSAWVQRSGCSCFCFSKTGLANPPPWIPGHAPPRGTKPTPVPPPEGAQAGPTIFSDPIFLGGPPLWDADECRARQPMERQYDIGFFCTCCCPR